MLKKKMLFKKFLTVYMSFVFISTFVFTSPAEIFAAKNPSSVDKDTPTVVNTNPEKDPEDMFMPASSLESIQIINPSSADKFVPTIVSTDSENDAGIFILRSPVESFAANNPLSADKNAPTVVSTDPEKKARDVPVDKSITVSFSENIMAGFNYEKIKVQNPKGEIVNYRINIDDNILIIDQVDNLEPDAKYKVTIPSKAVQDNSGNSLKKSFTFEYTTGSPEQNEEMSSEITNVPAERNTLDLVQVGIKGDGTDEASTLQRALDYARDNAIGTVAFPSGKTILIGSPVTVHKGLIVEGNGCTLKLADNHPNLNCFVYLKEYTQTRQLRVDGNKDNGNTRSQGVRLYSNAIFEDNEVFNVSSYSVFTYKGDNIKIINNIIHDSDQYGIATNGDTGDLSTDITISGNKIYNCKEVGIKIRWCSNSQVTQNTITIPDIPEGSADGICLYSFDGPNSHVDITNNTIKGEGTSGYNLGINSDNEDNEYINISKNKIDDVYRGISINFPGANVTENVINNCAWTGIWLVSNESIVENNILTNSGIMINNKPGYNSSRNLIKGNKINGGNQYWRAKNTGVYIWYATAGNIIEGNEIRVDDYAVKITDEFGLSTGTIVRNNTIYSQTDDVILDLGISTITTNNTIIKS